MRRSNKMKIFKVNRNIEVVCEAQGTRSGFRHLATLFIGGEEIDNAKCTYINRTWERYEFESVLQKLADKANISDGQSKTLKKYIKSYDRVEDSLKPLKTVANVMVLGNIFGQAQKEQNDWKTRMLKAGLEGKGLIMPDNWDQLSEDEKTHALNGAIKILQ